MTIHEAMSLNGRARKADWDTDIYVSIQTMGFVMSFPGVTGEVTAMYNNVCITDDDWLSYESL